MSQLTVLPKWGCKRHFFFPIAFIIFPLLFSLPPSCHSDPGSLNRLSSPIPTTVRPFHFCREEISAPSSLVDPRRVVLTHARRSQQLILLFLFLQMHSKSHRGGIRTHGPTLFNSSIRGLPTTIIATRLRGRPAMPRWTNMHGRFVQSH